MVISLFVLVFIGSGVLGAFAVWLAMVAEYAEHERTAQFIFDELEDELSAMIAVEEGRSFLEYRYFYVPDNSASAAGIVRSPLAEGPKADWILGYFQVEPDGEPTFPTVPRANEVQLAEAEGWSIEGVADQLRTLAQSSSGGDSWIPSPKQQSRGDSFYRGASKRAGREPVTAQTQMLNFNAFNENPEGIEQTVQSAQAPAMAVADVDVLLSPMSGVRRSDFAVLSRQVRVGGQAYRQGVAVDMPLLLEDLQHRVVVGSTLDGAVELSLDPDALEPAFATFSHQFAEPFDGFEVHLEMQRLGFLPRGLVWSLSLLALTLGVLIVVVAYAISGIVATELAFAQRRSDFVAAVSHELRTPITSIRMYGEMLRDGMVTDPVQMARYHGTIASESERLSRLISNVLELARLERGEGSEVVVGDVGAAVTDAIDQVRPLLASKGFTLDVQVEAGLPAVRYEPDGLRQILFNLVDNAAKFSGDAEQKVVTVRAQAEGGVRLSVLDRGPGIPPTQLQEVFEPFFRGERELTRVTTGTGIGLALVAGLAEGMGGGVGAANREGGGLEVWVRLEPA